MARCACVNNYDILCATGVTIMEHKKALRIILAAILCIFIMPAAAFAEDGGAVSVAIDAEHFPDDGFREFVSYYYDKDKDGILSSEEIGTVRDMTVTGFDDKVDTSGVTSLQGLEYFTGIVQLNVYSFPKLKSLDLTKMSNLETVSVNHNDALTEVNITGMENLTGADFSDNETLNEIAIDGCTKLIPCVSEENRGYLDYDAISFRSKEGVLSVGGWMYVVIDGEKYHWGGIPINSENFPDPEFRAYLRDAFISLGEKPVHLDNNEDSSLSEEEIARCTTFTAFTNEVRSLEGIGYFNAIDTLRLSEENFYLEELDLSGMTALKELYLGDHPELKSLDISGCTELEYLHAPETGLTTLDLNNNTKLQKIYLGNTPGLTIDISRNQPLIDAVQKSTGKYNEADDTIYYYAGDVSYFQIAKKAKLIYDKPDNNIIASNVERKFSLKKQTFTLNAYTIWADPLTFKSANSNYISIGSTTGKVTVKAAYVGKATITITAPETHRFKEATKRITIKVLPAAPTLKSVANTGKGKVTVKWTKTKSTKCTGYKVIYSTSSKFTKATTKTVTVKGVSTLSKVLTKLKKGKTYHISVRAYLKQGVAVYESPWSKVLKVKIKK